MALPATKMPKSLRKGAFSSKQAETRGIPRYQLSRLVKDGSLERLERGVYRLPQNDYNEYEQYQAATLRVGEQSAICLLSALVFYHLTDLIEKETWLMVEENKRTSQKGLKLFRMANPQWDIGIDKEDGFKITSLERTLVDSIIYNRQMSRMIGIESLKTAIAQKKTTLAKVADMAVRLGAFHRILPVIEVLA
jgi:predicted transcriptional regulator of viral defense system